MANTTTYTFDSRTRDARDQVRLLAQILDPHTFDVLDSLDLPLGARCADLGSGGGTVAVRLAQEAGPDAQVIAVDQQPQHVPDHPQIIVRQQDLLTTALEPDSFDLIHERLVSMHLGPREDLLRQWAAALKPGAAMVSSQWATDHLEDMWVAGPEAVREVFDVFQQTMIRVAERNGMDSTWARRVPAVMREIGLTGIRSETYNRLWRGGEPGLLLHASNSRQLERLLLDAGMTPGQLDVLRAAMNDAAVMARSWPMHTTIGFRPTA